MELCITHGLKVLVEGGEGERISQMSRWAGSKSWRGQDRPTDWVWVKECPGRCYAVLNGRLPWQVEWLFKIKLLNEDGALVEYGLALALTTIPENSSTLDPLSKFVQLRKAPEAVASQDISVGNIVNCEQMIPQIGTSSKTGNRLNEGWIVNSRIDLATWNDVYN